MSVPRFSTLRVGSCLRTSIRWVFRSKPPWSEAIASLVGVVVMV